MLAAAAVLLLAAGCSSGSSDPAPTGPASPPTAEPTVAEPTAPSSPTAAGACPDGAYRVTALEGRGAASTIGRGTGGDITADFTAGTFTLASNGADPVRLRVGPTGAQLRFAGTIVASYAGDTAALRLTTTRADGQVSVKGLGVSRTLSGSELADQLIGQGTTAQVTCDEAAGTAVMILPAAALTLTRAGR